MANERLLGMAIMAAAVGAGAAVLGPGLVRAFRPTLRKALAQGIVLARTSQVAIEAAWEDFEDFLAEARAEADHAAAAAQTEARSETGQAPASSKTEKRSDAPSGKVTPLQRKDRPKRQETREPPHES